MLITDWLSIGYKIKYLFELNALFYLTQKLSFKELPLFNVFKTIVYHFLTIFRF